MLLHLFIFGVVLSLSATALVLMCCAVGARADTSEDEGIDAGAMAPVEAVVGEVPLSPTARATRPTLG